jgi:23S rRNA (adenine2503-C2)-methyltransferase
MSKVVRTLKSLCEPSTNFLIPYGKGIIETRYVRKANDYVACYVSSHNGCKMGCLMCHLTHNEDITMNHVNIPTYLHQIRTVLNHYAETSSGQTANRCNVNFMAKGDALANKYLVNQYPELFNGMKEVCADYGLTVKPNVSTIMPFTVAKRDLSGIFCGYPAYLYYSLYSINTEFRSKWLPNAIPYQEALDKLAEFQESDPHKNVITFHWAFIKGQNDHLDEVKELAKILKDYNFHGKLNIVRFNPHPDVSDKETEFEKIQELFNVVADVFKNPKSYIVPRLDVSTKTPCGMFVPIRDLSDDE